MTLSLEMGIFSGFVVRETPGYPDVIGNSRHNVAGKISVIMAPKNRNR